MSLFFFSDEPKAPADAPAPVEATTKPAAPVKRTLTIDLDHPDEAQLREAMRVAGRIIGKKGGRKPKAKNPEVDAAASAATAAP